MRSTSQAHESRHLIRYVWLLMLVDVCIGILNCYIYEILTGQRATVTHNIFKGNTLLLSLKIYPISEHVGVNQSGNTSQLLFRRDLHYLNDYLEEHTGVCIADEILLHMLWADDLVIISSNPKHAQRQLDGLSKFCATNQMVANELKTKYMFFLQSGQLLIRIKW